MADWFKFYENGLDEPRLQYAIGQLSEVTPVWVGILSECCRHKDQSIGWDDDEAYLMGFSRRLNIALPKVNEAINLLKRIHYISVESGRLTVLKWNDFQSEYMKRKERETKPSVRTVSEHTPNTVGVSQLEERRGEEIEEIKEKKPSASRFAPPNQGDVQLHCHKIGLPYAEGEAFMAYYESNGWRVGRNPMRSWQAAMINWRKNFQERKNGRTGNNPQANPRNLFTCKPVTDYGEAGRRKLARQEEERLAKEVAQNGTANPPSTQNG